MIVFVINLVPLEARILGNIYILSLLNWNNTQFPELLLFLDIYVCMYPASASSIPSTDLRDSYYHIIFIFKCLLSSEYKSGALEFILFLLEYFRFVSSSFYVV